LFSIPYLVHTFSKFGPDRLQTELGTFTARNFLLATAFTAGGLIVMGRVAARSLSRPTRATVGAIGLGGLYLLAALLFWGGGFLRTETHCFDPHCAGQTFRNVLTWHGNPKVVPVGLILLAFAGLGSFRCRRQARLLAVLVTWFGMSIAAASVKMTGELPFEGLRTQLPASVPFLLVAGIGAHHLFPARSGTGLRVAVLAVLIGCTAVVPFRVLQSFGFDEQDEYRFLEECMAKIPANATLYVPDDTLDALLPGDTEPTQVDLAGLFRSHFVVESLGEKSRGIRTRRISSLLEYGPQGPSYFFRGLNCYRTGSRTMTPACSAALWSLRLDAVCEQTVANRPYTADFYPALKILPDRIPLGIYRIVPPGEESNAEAGDCQSQ